MTTVSKIQPERLTLKQLFRFGDRKDVKYLLSPTHEEEITSLVSNTVKSYRELPVRLFQICMVPFVLLTCPTHIDQHANIVTNYGQDTGSFVHESL